MLLNTLRCRGHPPQQELLSDPKVSGTGGEKPEPNSTRKRWSCNLPGSGLIRLDIAELPASQERYGGKQHGPFEGFLFPRLHPVLILKPTSLVALQI